MASSDSDDDVIATSLFLLTSIVHEKHKLHERGQKRKTWERDWIAKRRQYGAYHGLLREIRVSDPAAYRNFLRMNDKISLYHSVQNILVTDQLKCVNLCPNFLNFIMYIIISNNLWTKFWVPPITSLYYVYTVRLRRHFVVSDVTMLMSWVPVARYLLKTVFLRLEWLFVAQCLVFGLSVQCAEAEYWMNRRPFSESLFVACCVKVAACDYEVARCDCVARQSRASKSRHKIAVMTSVFFFLLSCIAH